MTVELTDAEVEMLEGARGSGEDAETALHRLLEPMLAKYGESRLQNLADLYRGLPPTRQIEAIKILTSWQQTKK